MKQVKRFLALFLVFAMVIGVKGETKVGAATTQFNLNLKIQKTASGTAKLSWNAVPGATGYEAQYHRDGRNWANDPEYRSGTSYTSTDMLNLVYYFRVRAKFSGSTSEWVEVWVNVSNGSVSPNSGSNKITIPGSGAGGGATPTPTPTPGTGTGGNGGQLASPPVLTNGVNMCHREGQAIAFSWTRATNVTHYTLHLLRVEDRKHIDKSNITDAKYTLGLEAGTYLAWVEAHNSITGQSLNGERGKFSVVSSKYTSDITNVIEEPDNFYVKQATSYTCPLASVVMMFRRGALLNGYSKEDWEKISEGTKRSSWWDPYGCMAHEVYALNMKTICVGTSSINDKVTFFKEKLANNPQGVVISYMRTNGSRWHSVLLTRYDELKGIFYCVDPWTEREDKTPIPTAEIPLTGSLLNGPSYAGYYTKKQSCNNTQEEILREVDQYWELRLNTATNSPDGATGFEEKAGTVIISIK